MRKLSENWHRKFSHLQRQKLRIQKQRGDTCEETRGAELCLARVTLEPYVQKSNIVTWRAQLQPLGKSPTDLSSRMKEIKSVRIALSAERTESWGPHLLEKNKYSTHLWTTSRCHNCAYRFCSSSVVIFTLQPLFCINTRALMLMVPRQVFFLIQKLNWAKMLINKHKRHSMPEREHFVGTFLTETEIGFF